MSSEQLNKDELFKILKEKVGDSFSTLQLISLRESDGREQIREKITKVLNDFAEELGTEEKLEIELVPLDLSLGKFEVRPKNEISKRMIQMMNLQMPHLRR